MPTVFKCIRERQSFFKHRVYIEFMGLCKVLRQHWQTEIITIAVFETIYANLQINTGMSRITISARTRQFDKYPHTWHQVQDQDLLAR